MTARIDFLVFLLVAAGLASAAMNIYLMRQRTIEVVVSPQRVSTPPEGSVEVSDDEYVTHAFPSGREVCTSFDTICWIRI
jgi:hypothetical protein